MPDWSRRRALHAISTAAAVAVAGCSGDGGFEDPPPDDRGDPVEGYDLRMVRDERLGALFWAGDDRPEAGDERAISGQEFVSSDDDLASLSFATDSDAARELASFVEETDFDAASVLVEAWSVRACNRLVFRGVRRSEDSLHTQYCSRLRPADAACSVDEEHAVGVGIRLPFPDAEFSSRGSRHGSDCDPLPVDAEADENVGEWV